MQSSNESCGRYLISHRNLKMEVLLFNNLITLLWYKYWEDLYVAGKQMLEIVNGATTDEDKKMERNCMMSIIKSSACSKQCPLLSDTSSTVTSAKLMMSTVSFYSFIGIK